MTPPRKCTRKWLDANDDTLLRGPYLGWLLADLAAYDPSYLRDTVAVRDDIDDSDRNEIIAVLENRRVELE